MNNSYYQKLQNLVQEGRLQTYIIIAPPRTNSSVVEHTLGNSPDIDHECHEPFLNARHGNFNPDHGYRQIYESIGGEKFEQSGESTTVVIKEMSHWISQNEEYKRLVELTTRPIVLLIRNPLLAAESRLRRVLTTIDMRHSVDLQHYLLDELAIEKGYQNWNKLTREMKIDAYTDRLAALPNQEDVDQIYDAPDIAIQNHLLDQKAHNNNYVNWREMVKKKLYTEHDYVFFDVILQLNQRRLSFEEDEFRKLEEEKKYFEEQKYQYVIFDTTDLRAEPTKQIQELCHILGIQFSPEMIEWGEKSVDFHTEQTKQSEKMWYSALYSSVCINPPIEISPSLNKFPAFMQEYLKSDNLPIYGELSKSKILKNELRHELNEQEFPVEVTNGNKEHFIELGLIENETKIGENIFIKLKYIDPIYAVSNEPELIEQSEFQIYKNLYGKEMQIVYDSVSTEESEHTQEMKIINKEIKF
jgi:hypothetical protein